MASADCAQSEDFDEDEMIYDELRLDEEEEKFGKLAHDEDDESDIVSEGAIHFVYFASIHSCPFSNKSGPPASNAQKGVAYAQRGRRLCETVTREEGRARGRVARPEEDERAVADPQ